MAESEIQNVVADARADVVGQANALPPDALDRHDVRALLRPLPDTAPITDITGSIAGNIEEDLGEDILPFRASSNRTAATEALHPDLGPGGAIDINTLPDPPI